MKDMLERLQMRPSILFLSYRFESAVWNERNCLVFESFQTQTNVRGRSRQRELASRGCSNDLFELVILLNVISFIMFQNVQCCSCVSLLCG